MKITPEQIRAARALLRLEQAELAKRAHVSFVTIRRFKAEHGSAFVAPATLESVQRVLEQAGAEFIHDGVRRTARTRPDAASRFEDLRGISLRCAARLGGRSLLSEHDLYDENGLPA